MECLVHLVNMKQISYYSSGADSTIVLDYLLCYQQPILPHSNFLKLQHCKQEASGHLLFTLSNIHNHSAIPGWLNYP